MDEWGYNNILLTMKLETINKMQLHFSWLLFQDSEKDGEFPTKFSKVLDSFGRVIYLLSFTSGFTSTTAATLAAEGGTDVQAAGGPA